MNQDNKLSPYSSLKTKEFKRFLFIRFAMVFAWSMQFTVIEWEVYRMTNDFLSLGYIGLLEVIPSVSMALFAGHFVDNSDKKKLLLVTILGFSLISGTLFYLTTYHSHQNLPKTTILYGIYACVFLGGFVRAFIGPTIFSLLGQIVPKKLYSNASTWSSSAWQIGSVIGPATGGFAISWIGESGALLVVMFMSLTVFIITLTFSEKPSMNTSKGEPLKDSLKNGLKFVFSTKEILGALTLDMVAVLFGGAVALLPVYAKDILDVGSLGYGFLRGAPAVGSFLTMLTITFVPMNKKAGIKLLFAVAGFGVSIIVFGVSNWFVLSLVALFFSGVFDGISVVIRQTILQLYTPDDMRGRVASVNSMFVGSSNELGAFESGFVAHLIGPVATVVGGGMVTILVVIMMGKTMPTLRKIEFD